jgi:hypothetical protein
MNYLYISTAKCQTTENKGEIQKCFPHFSKTETSNLKILKTFLMNIQYFQSTIESKLRDDSLNSEIFRKI